MAVRGLRIFGGPGRYLQGPGALDELGHLVAAYGRRPLVIGDTVVVEMLGSRIRSVLAGSGLEPDFGILHGEITRDAISSLAATAGRDAPSIVVGVGGGKSLDAAKGVAMQLDLPVVTVPTIASNDSPTSAAIAVYDDNHIMVAVDRMMRNPDIVLVDTTVIAGAPTAFLCAGIGDAVAKTFEAQACEAGTGLTPFGTRPLATALAIAECCYRTLRAHSEAALAAADQNAVTDDLEAVVEACVLMSGLGFENGGLSLAHSLTRGLVRVRGARDASHGDQVAWATLVQLAADGRSDDEITDLIGFFRRIRLPTRLGDLGLTAPTDDDIADIARWTMTAPHLENFATPLDHDVIAAAIRRAEALAARS